MTDKRKKVSAPAAPAAGGSGSIDRAEVEWRRNEDGVEPKRNNKDTDLIDGPKRKKEYSGRGIGAGGG
jgi:hypothetical protein